MGCRQPFPPNKPRGVPRVNDRRVLNGIFWVLRSGAPWRDLPDNFGPYTTCYNRFVRWRRAGVWDRLMNIKGVDGRDIGERSDAVCDGYARPLTMRRVIVKGRWHKSINRLHCFQAAKASANARSPPGPFSIRRNARRTLLNTSATSKAGCSLSSLRLYCESASTAERPTKK